MSLRRLRLVLALFLVIPVVFALGFGQRGVQIGTRVLAASQSRMVGPLNPPLIDTNGDGLASAGDQTISVTRAGTTVTIASPWDCNPADADNRFQLSNPDGSGRYRTARRVTDHGSQTITITSFTPGGAPLGFQFDELSSRAHRTGHGQLVDANGDGVADGVTGQETGVQGLPLPGGVSISLSLVQSDVNADGNPDYLSIPWSQASAVGVNTSDGCGPGGADPQVWLPMADVNGDGINDGLVLDLDGDGVADADLFTGPSLARGSGNTRLIGPNFPILIDTNGDGRPTPGVDLPLVPERAGSTIVLNTPWDTNRGNDNHRLALLDLDGSNKFTRLSRTNGALVQQAVLTDFVGGRPTGITFAQTGARSRQGSGHLVDRNGDGVFDGFTAVETGGSLRLSVDFTPADVNGDGNPDYISIPWSQASALGVDVDDNVGPGGRDPQIWVPLADTDGDGINDGVAFDLNGDGIPDPDLYGGPQVAGGERRYSMAEGATNGFLETWVLLANPSATPAPATITWLRDNGAPIAQTLTVPPQARLSLRAADVAGLGPSAHGTVVDSTGGTPLGVEHAMYYGGYAGGHAEGATETTATRWYFAEGCECGFTTYYLLTNENPAPASVTFTFLLEDGSAPITTTVSVPARARTNYQVAARVPQLSGRAFAAVVDADLPIVAERSMFFAGNTASHESMGATALSRSWYHADGAVGPVFDTFVLLANPNATPAAVTLTFRPTGGSTVTRSFTMAARSRTTYWVDPDLEPATAGPVWIAVDASQPIVSERSMYWPGSVATWIEGHNSLGQADPQTRWLLAEGSLGGALGFETFLVLANPNATAATVHLTFLRDAGEALGTTVTVPANGRLDVNAATQVPALAGQSFGVVADVTNGVPVVLERSMYWAARGVARAGGSNAVARRLP